MDSTSYTEPLGLMSGSLNLIFLLYALWLIWSGSPIWKMRARPVGTRPVVLENKWFRITGGIYVAGFLLEWIIPGLARFDGIIFILAGIPYAVGLWKSLAPKVL